MQTLMAIQLLGGFAKDVSAVNSQQGFQPTNTLGAVNQIGQTAMFKKMLADASSPNANKMSLGADGITLKLTPGTPMYNMLMGELSGVETEGPFKGMSKGWNPTKQGGGQTSVANPFDSELVKQSNSGIDLASAAFLTPENIATIAGIKGQQDRLALERDTLENKRITDVIDMMYKGAEIERSRVETKKIQTEIDLNTPVYKDPTTGVVLTSKQLLDKMEIDAKTQPEIVRTYNAMVEQNNSLGKKSPTLETYLVENTTEIKNYNKARQQAIDKGIKPPTFDAWVKGYKAAGASRIDLSGKIAAVEGEGLARHRVDVRSPKLFEDVKSELAKGNDWPPYKRVEKLSRIYPKLSRPALLDIAEKEAVRRDMDTRIMQAYPKDRYKTFYIRGDGWYYMKGKTKELIQRDPYAD